MEEKVVVKQFKLATKRMMTFRQNGKLHLGCSAWTCIVGVGFSKSDATTAAGKGLVDIDIGGDMAGRGTEREENQYVCSSNRSRLDMFFFCIDMEVEVAIYLPG